MQIIREVAELRQAVAGLKKEGRVAFKNFYTGKTKIVKAGKTALAKPPPKRR